MSLFSSLSQRGSILSEEGMMHAREGYRPTRVVPTAEMAFAHWTERVSQQSEIVSARELAGLSDENLGTLALEFETAPRRKRNDSMRFAFPLAALSALAGAVLVLAARALPSPSPGLSGFEVGAIVTFGATFISLCAGALAGFRLVPIEVAYGKVGLLVGVINEQHPWLYKTHLLMRNDAARNYRAKVLAERGPLRGMDYVMMREIAGMHESLELTKTAREVALAVQGPANPAPASTLLA